MPRVVADDIDALLNCLPPHIAECLRERGNLGELLEVVMDLGRPLEARYTDGDAIFPDKEITREDIDYVVSKVGEFNEDNRAGIERTLHRISAIRNRNGRIIGLSCRVGRAVFGTVELIRDLVESGRNILLLGWPGVGKTTMLREVARVLADELGRRVIVVDTSNEIAGDGDIPHPAIGRARRMQVPKPALQHAVMIEAVENHMPEVIIIDEIGTELEAAAARTIAERGVQLIGTAHGNTLENLILNPTLSDLVGGVQVVTLSDEEARRRGVQKSIMERKLPPTFDVVVEMINREQVVINHDVAAAVDAILRGTPIPVEVRWFDESGAVRRERRKKYPSIPPQLLKAAEGEGEEGREEAKSVLAFGISRSRLEKIARRRGFPLILTDNLSDAELILTSMHFYQKKPPLLEKAEENGIPIYVLRNGTVSQLERSLEMIFLSGKAASPPSSKPAPPSSHQIRPPLFATKHGFLTREEREELLRKLGIFPK